MLLKRRYIVAIHFICWLIFFSLPAIFIAGFREDIELIKLITSPSWLYFSIYIFTFYFHTYFLAPKCYFKKYYVRYGLAVSLLFFAVYYISPFEQLISNEVRAKQQYPDQKKIKQFEKFLQSEMNKAGTMSDSAVRTQTTSPSTGISAIPSSNVANNHTSRPKFDIISIVLYILILSLSFLLVMVNRWQQMNERVSRSEADRIKAELSVLKAQVNPHFLFNTLNNIYTQAIMHDEKTPESIMKLSNIMRYVSDESTEDFVSLAKDAQFINDYIGLQRMRLGSKVSLDFAINGSLSDKVIAPLILIPFIENVFKYGISNIEPTTITIELRAYADSIGFFCRNKIHPGKNQFERSGIGIANTKKRLEHLYPQKHSLTIKEEDGFYSVLLILQC